MAERIQCPSHPDTSMHGNAEGRWICDACAADCGPVDPRFRRQCEEHARLLAAELEIQRLQEIIEHIGDALDTAIDVILRRRAAERGGKSKPARSRKHRITSEHLAAVAKTYLEAKDWPTKAVAEQMHVSRSTAATWVGLARKAGLIPAVG